MRFFLGGYTADMGGAASGIGVVRAGGPHDVLAGGSLAFADVAPTGGSPSWIAWHPTLDVLYAALEGDGAVQAFRRTGEESFARLGPAVAAGEAVCHVAVAPDGRSLLASCWGDGRVVRMALDAAGRPSTPVVAPAAADPYDADATAVAPVVGDLDLAAAARALRAAAGAEYAHLVPDFDRNAGGAGDEMQPPDAPVARPSRAHQARFLPGGSVVTTDLGLDLVRFWRDAGRLQSGQAVALPKGSGPRHAVWHPSGHLYVVTELSREVFVLARDAAGAWRLVGGAPLSPATLDTDAAAEIALSHDARFVYAGVRGSDTIATLRVSGDGSGLAPVALVESGTAWPRHHVVARDTLLVAGQRADEVVSLGLDTRTGVPGRARHRVAAPAPTCLLPDRS